MYAVAALIGLMLLTWAAAVWATYADDEYTDTGTAAGRRVFRKFDLNDSPSDRGHVQSESIRPLWRNPPGILLPRR